MPSNAPIENALTIDVEDYFQVSAMAPYIDRADWDRCECRVEHNIDRILQLLAAKNTHATFFTLGWIAERYPDMVRRIVREGHELASHGYGHQRVSDLTEAEFFDDITRSKGLLEDLGGQAVWAIGRRASPSVRRTCGRSTPCSARATATAPASTRSSTTTTACPMRRASPTRPRAA